MQSTNLASISSSNLKELPVLLPGMEEQERIVAYIETKARGIDAVISRERGLIDQLSALRTSLISEVVTGKIDVRSSRVAAEEGPGEGIAA